MQKEFFKGIKIESDTEYVFSGERIDFYLSDATRTTNAEYRGLTKRAGDYLDVAFLIKGVKNVTLDFGGATLVFHGRIVPFILDGCEKVKIKNVKVDYDRPFYTQADVLSYKEGEMEIKIDEGFDYEVRDGYLIVKGDGWEKNLNRNDCLLWMVDKTGEKGYGIILGLFGEKIYPNDNPPLPIKQINIEEEGGGVLKLKGNFCAGWEYNDGKNKLVFTHEVRDKCTVTICGCRNTYIENFILIHGASMGITCMRSENIYIDGFSMYNNYNGNGRLVTNNADAIHTFNCSGEFVLKNSYMEGLLDDTVNVHNNYFLVKKIDGNKVYCFSKAAGLAFALECFSEGQEIAIFKGSTQEERGKYKILNITNDEENLLHVFELDREPVGVEKDDIVENLTAQPTILIENCKFGLFRGTMRLQSRGKTVVRNCVFGNKETSLLFTGDTTYWYESSPVQDVLIENCKFLNTKYGPRIRWGCYIDYTEKEKYYHKNITVRNCYFDKGEVAVFHHVDGFTFENNESDGEMTIKHLDSANVNIEGATVIK